MQYINALPQYLIAIIQFLIAIMAPTDALLNEIETFLNRELIWCQANLFEYREGRGEKGVEALKKYVREGGTIVLLDYAAELVIKDFAFLFLFLIYWKASSRKSFTGRVRGRGGRGTGEF